MALWLLEREFSLVQRSMERRMQALERGLHEMEEMVRRITRRHEQTSLADVQYPLIPPMGTAAQVLSSLPSKVYCKKEEGKEEETCAICLSNFEEKDAYRVLPCKHRFHQECTDKWLMKRASCPVCRAEVDLDMLRRMSACWRTRIAEEHGRKAKRQKKYHYVIIYSKFWLNTNKQWIYI